MSLEELLQQLRQEYLLSFPEKLNALQQAITHRDYTEIERLTHQLKGTGKTYGFQEITELATPIEQSARQKEIKCIDWSQKAVEILKQWVAAHQSKESFDLKQDPGYIKLISEMNKDRK